VNIVFKFSFSLVFLYFSSNPKYCIKLIWLRYTKSYKSQKHQT